MKVNFDCPHCNKSLIEDNMLKLKIHNGEEGFLMLSPYLNVFTSKSTIFLEEDKTLKDVRCWHCDKSLIPEEKNCEKCGSDVVKIEVGARTKLIDFYICILKAKIFSIRHSSSSTKNSIAHNTFSVIKI